MTAPGVPLSAMAATVSGTMAGGTATTARSGTVSSFWYDLTVRMPSMS
jgi:hypothetical protein